MASQNSSLEKNQVNLKQILMSGQGHIYSIRPFTEGGNARIIFVECNWDTSTKSLREMSRIHFDFEGRKINLS